MICTTRRTPATAGRGSVPAVEALESRHLMAATHYLSDLAPESAANGLGPVELDMSNGGPELGDGRPLAIGSKTYGKGLGVRAGSTVVYDLGGKYDRFDTLIGIDRQGGKKGGVYFRVFLDGKKVYDSGKVVGGQAAKAVSVPVTGKKQLKLVVADAGGGKEFDIADWATARLTSRRNLPRPVPAAPNDLVATATSATSGVELTWIDNAANERRFEVERSTDGQTFATVATLPLNAAEFHDPDVSPGTTYYYRVRAANAVGRSAPTATVTVDVPPIPPPTPPSPPDARPTAANTGVANAATLRKSESITVDTDGAIIEDVNVDGMIYVNASNVTIRNFRVTSSDDYGIFIADGATNVTIADGEVTGSHVAAVYGANFTARRLHIHDVGADGIKALSDCVVDRCYIHNLGMDPGAHADGVQGSGGTNITITNNNVDVPEHTTTAGQTYLSNAAVFVHSFFGPVDQVLIQGNWLNGGNYTIYSIDAGTGHGPPTNVRIVSNVFGPDYKYGTLDIDHPADGA